MRFRDFLLAILLGLFGAWLLGGADIVRDHAPLLLSRQTVADFFQPGRPLSASAARRLERECAAEACK